MTKPVNAFGSLPEAAGQQRVGGGAFGGRSGMPVDVQRPLGYQGQGTSGPSQGAVITTGDGAFGASAGVVQRRLWELVPLDLRGDLAASNSYGTEAMAVPRELMHGNHLSLYVTIEAILLTASVWRFSYVTRSHALNPRLLAYNSAPFNISSQVYSGFSVPTAGARTTYTTTLVFPLHSPVRFWGLAIVSDLVFGAVGAQQITISSELH